MRAIRVAVLSTFFAFLLTGCPGGGGTDGGMGGGTGGSGGGGRAGGSGGSGGSGGTGGSGGAMGGGSGGSGGSGGGAMMMGTSCQNALPLTLGTIANGFIDAGTQLHYRLDTTAGQWLDVVAIKVGMSPVDTAVTFFDVNGTTKLASFDDQIPRPNNATATNTAFQHHVATTGPICIRLEDYSSWAMDTSVVNRGAVRLLVGVIDAGTNFVNFDSEPNDMASAAQNGKAIIAGGQFYGELYGLLNNATDQDVYAFTTGDGGVTLEIDVLPVGDTRFPAMNAVSSYGSTLPRYTATVQDMSGAVLASLPPPAGDVNAQSQSLYVPVTPFTRYTVHIQRPAGIAAGANDFYVANVSGGDIDNDPEVEPNENDGTATPLNFNMGQAFLRGTISTAGTDVDTFSLPVTANGVVEVVCSSRRSGSGLRGFNVELHDSAGTSLKNETETETATLAWLSDDLTANPPQLGDAVRVGDAGTYFLKFTAPTQDTTVTGKHYRCGVTVTP